MVIFTSSRLLLTTLYLVKTLLSNKHDFSMTSKVWSSNQSPPEVAILLVNWDSTQIWLVDNPSLKKLRTSQGLWFFCGDQKDCSLCGWQCRIANTLTGASLLFMENPPFAICGGGEISGVTGLKSCLCWVLMSSAMDMVCVTVDSYGMDEAVDWGLSSIVECKNRWSRMEF